MMKLDLIDIFAICAVSIIALVSFFFSQLAGFRWTNDEFFVLFLFSIGFLIIYFALKVTAELNRPLVENNLNNENN